MLRVQIPPELLRLKECKMPFILLVILTLMTIVLAIVMFVVYCERYNREVPPYPWYPYWIGLAISLISWLIIVGSTPGIPHETHVLGIIEVHGNASSVQYYVGPDGKPVSVQEVFKCVLPPGGKVRRIVYRQMYWGVHFMGTDVHKDRYEIVDE
jgi:hypothetical protein